jgi:hypothetical protein
VQVQGLIQAHKSADEAGVTGLPQPEGSFADLNGVGVDASIRLLAALAKFGNWMEAGTQCRKDGVADGGVCGDLQTAKKRLVSWRFSKKPVRSQYMVWA